MQQVGGFQIGLTLQIYIFCVTFLCHLPGGIRDLSSQLLSISEETPLSDGLGGKDAIQAKKTKQK